MIAKDNSVKNCPDCGKEMVLRTGRLGKFYGCSGFPNCRKTMRYTEPSTSGPIVKKPFGVPAGFILSEQQQAIHHELIHGSTHVLVEARAGCSKTTTLTWVLPLLGGALKIGFSAFNKHIVKELATRCPDNVEAFTMHSLGFKACRKGLGSVVVDADKVAGILDDLLQDDGARRSALREAVIRLVAILKATMDEPTPRNLDTLADRYGVTIESGNGNSFSGGTATVLSSRVTRDEVFDLVPRVLEMNNKRTSVIDMDDMIYLPVKLNLPVDRYDVFLLDEGQDLNKAQQQLVFMACPTGRIVLVGDPFQSIYGFRCADVNSMPNMEKMLSESPRGCKKLFLTYTRRCPKSHVAIAQGVVPDFFAFDNAPEGEVIEMGIWKAQAEMQKGDMVLCRNNGPLVKIAHLLLQRGVPCLVRGRDIGAGLQNLIRLLKAVDIKELTSKLDDWEDKEKSRLLNAKKPGSYIQAVMDKAETLRALIENCADLTELRAKIDTLFSDSENVEGKVLLSSVHRAKGLESKRVFIANPELLPHPMARGKEDYQQERNVAYVAVTRAIETLIFIGEIPPMFAKDSTEDSEPESDESEFDGDEGHWGWQNVGSLSEAAALLEDAQGDGEVFTSKIEHNNRVITNAILGAHLDSLEPANPSPLQRMMMDVARPIVEREMGIERIASFMPEVGNPEVAAIQEKLNRLTTELIGEALRRREMFIAEEVLHSGLDYEGMCDLVAEYDARHTAQTAMQGATEITVEKGGTVFTYAFDTEGYVIDTNDHHRTAQAEARGKWRESLARPVS